MPLLRKPGSEGEKEHEINSVTRTVVQISSVTG